jgi:hypothetical protein
MSPEPNSPKRFARVQRKPDGRLLAVCIVVPAGVLVESIDRGREKVEYRLKAMHGGIMVVIEEGQA